MNKKLTIEEFKEVIDEQILYYKDSNDPIPELNNNSLQKIESYLEMPFQTGFGQELYPTVYDKASILCYLIIKNHPLSNGNKRMGIISMLLFLDKNGVDVPDFKVYDLAKYVAKSDSNDKDKVLQHIKNTIQPMDKLAELKDKLQKAKTNKVLPENMRAKLIEKYEGEIAKLEAEPAPLADEPAKTKKPKKAKKIVDHPSAPNLGVPEKKKKGKSIDLNDDYDCDTIIAEEKERAKKRKEAKAARENAPKKTPVTKAKEKVEKAAETIMDRVESGTASKSEITKLIASVKSVLSKLEKALTKLK